MSTFILFSVKNFKKCQNSRDVTHFCAQSYLFFYNLSEVPKLSSYAKAEDKLLKYLFGNYQKWVRPVDHLNQTIRVKFGLAISQLVDVVRIRTLQR